MHLLKRIDPEVAAVRPRLPVLDLTDIAPRLAASQPRS